MKTLFTRLAVTTVTFFSAYPLYAFDSEYHESHDNSYRYIEANGLPNHDHGSFPNKGNPNAIKEQHYKFRMPYSPTKLDSVIPVGDYTFGIATNGVIFDPVTAGFWNDDRESGWRYEAFPKGLGIDSSNAHVQPNGAYHYHGIPTGILDNSSNPQLVGYAADGFPIYYYYDNSKSPSYKLKAGSRPSDNNAPGGTYDGSFAEDYIFDQNVGNLDECNGTYDITREYPSGTYLYVVTTNFPFVSRCFRGEPDNSFIKRHLVDRDNNSGRDRPHHKRGGNEHGKAHQRRGKRKH